MLLLLFLFASSSPAVAWIPDVQARLDVSEAEAARLRKTVANQGVALSRVEARLTALEAACAFLGTSAASESAPRTKGIPDGLAGARSLQQVSGEGSVTRVDSTSVTTRILNVTDAIFLTGTFFWNGREWGPNDPTLQPTSAPTLAPTLHPTASARTLTAAEIAGARCTTAVHSLTIDVSSPASWKFYDITTNSATSTTWYCDITVADTFDSVLASYTLRGFDPITAAATHPDDNFPMTSWGSAATGDGGYFSFGTPATILNRGGTYGGNVGYGKTQGFTFAQGSVSAANVIRFGFSQSSTNEDFSLEDLVIKVRVV